jgi:putative heme degradation protein
VELAGAPGTLRGVTFLDAAGESLFGVYVPEGADKKPELVAQFEKTRAVIASLPRVCG